MISQVTRQVISRYLVVLSVVAVFPTVGFASAVESKTATETIRSFYLLYLNYDYHKTPNKKRPTIAISKSFSEAAKRNREICAAYSSEICGWGAFGNKYLDAQEIGPNLSYETSGITITEIEPNVVQVKLNVYPSVKDADGYYDKTITYRLVKENGKMVVDDIYYSDGISTRKAMADENAEVIAHPSKLHNQ